LAFDPPQPPKLPSDDRPALRYDYDSEPFGVHQAAGDGRSPDRAYAATDLKRPRRWVHPLLLALTIVTTTAAGAGHYAGFQSNFLPDGIEFNAGLLLGGLWYSGTILLILGAHELGHYFACRYYGVNASLPYFLPAPIPLTGTLGAFIRIRQPIATKRMLFDIGFAGPISGFIFAVPALLMGLSLSRVVTLPSDFTGLALGEPLLFQGAAWVVFGTVPEGHSVNMHPMAFAAWFGLLATALNLFPIGQLDGGHISYAVLGRRSTVVTMAAVGGSLVLPFLSLSWAVWTVLLVGMLLVFGPHHPRTFDEDVPLDPVRVRLAIFALLMLVLCFTPAPIEPFELLGGQ
jgi:membrane-associated protease RseP (regulator of RpoE activity)